MDLDRRMLIMDCMHFCRILRLKFYLALFGKDRLRACDGLMRKDRGIAQSIFAAGVYLGVGMSSISVIIDNNLG